MSVLLAAAVLLVAPQVAHAAFTGRAAPQQAVSTATLVEPTNLDGSYSCSYSRGRDRDVVGITVNVRNFDDAGPAGSTYDYRLVFSNMVLDSERTTSRSVTLGYSNSDGVSRPATAQLMIRATVRSWTGPWLTRNVTCS